MPLRKEISKKLNGIIIMMMVILLLIIMMMMMMIIIIMIVIIIITLKCAIRDFYNLFTAPQTVVNTYAQATRAQSCADHVQHTGRLSRATYRPLITCNMLCATW